MLVGVSLAAGVAISVAVVGGDEDGGPTRLTPSDTADQVDAAGETRSSATPAGQEAPPASPAAAAADPEAAVRGFLDAEADRDFAASYGFVSAEDRSALPSPTRWIDAHADFFPVTGFQVEEVRDAGPGRAEVVSLTTFRSSLDEVLGLVPARARATWIAVAEDGGWRVAFAASRVDALYPPDAEAPGVVRAWARALQDCAEPVQHRGGLVGSPALADELCDARGELDIGDPALLDDAQASPVVNAFGAEAMGWARAVAVRGAVELDAVVAPVDDAWVVIGVLSPRPVS